MSVSGGFSQMSLGRLQYAYWGSKRRGELGLQPALRQDRPAFHSPERMLLQLLHSVRSERRLIARLNYNLLFRWFVCLSMDNPV
jgi:hypothetical protein